jgi:hypothetical protein
MNTLNHYPPSCVLAAITSAAVDECDDLDGIKDGVISALSLCKFDPASTIGQNVDCNGTSLTISKLDAEVVSAIWQGPQASNGSALWYGLNRGAELDGLGGTACTSVTECTGTPMPVSSDYITRWVLQEPSFNLTALTQKDFARIFTFSVDQYHDLIGTSNPDLSAFRQAGGKMITWHGLADPLIFPQGTANYYQRVEALDAEVRDYYRFFEAPGVGHCGMGTGEIPSDPFDAVVAWVENGTAPETLAAVSDDGSRTRNLCLYPLLSVFKGGDPADASSFVCQSQF